MTALSPKRVEVQLEARGIDGDRGLVQGLGAEERVARVARAWPCPSRYGSDIAAEKFSATPSTMILTASARKTSSLPRPAASSRRRTNSSTCSSPAPRSHQALPSRAHAARPRSSAAMYASKIDSMPPVLPTHASAHPVTPKRNISSWPRTTPATASSMRHERNEPLHQEVCALVQRAGGVARGVTLDAAVGGVGGVAADARESQRGRVHPRAVVIAVHEEHRPVGNDGVESGRGGSAAWEERHRPAAARDPLAVGVRGRVGGDRSRRNRRASRASVRLHCNSSSPPWTGCACASMKPGMRSLPSRSTTRVAGPTSALTSASGATATIAPPRTATPTSRGAPQPAL